MFQIEYLAIVTEFELSARFFAFRRKTERMSVPITSLFGQTAIDYAKQELTSGNKSLVRRVQTKLLLILYVFTSNLCCRGPRAREGFQLI